MKTLTVEEEAIQAILSRAEKGRNEYGEGLHEAEKPLEEWMTFLTEELIDAALYLMKSRRKLTEILARQAETKAEEDKFNETVAILSEPEIREPKAGEVWESKPGKAYRYHNVVIVRVGKVVTYRFINSMSEDGLSHEYGSSLNWFLDKYTFIRESLAEEKPEPETRLPKVGEVWESPGGTCTIKGVSTDGMVDYVFIEKGTRFRMPQHGQIDVATFVKWYAPPNEEPEIKQPLVGEIWNGQRTSVRIMAVSEKRVSCAVLNAYGESSAVMDMPKEDFLESYKFGRS